MPELQAAVEGRDDAVLVTVAINGTAKQFRFVARRARLTAPVLMDVRHATLKAFGVRAVPTTFVLDATGRVARRLIGGYHKGDFVSALDGLK